MGLARSKIPAILGARMTHSLLSSLTIFFPCYNDQDTITEMIIEAYRLAPSCALDYEVIVVDDGSTDKSRQILTQLRQENPHLKLIFHDKNQGYGGALHSGFTNARKDYVFYTDGDGQYQLSDLKNLINLIDKDTPMVNGYKISRSDAWYRKLFGMVYQSLCKTMLGIKIRDTDCDFRLIKRDLLQNIQLKYKSGAVCAELVKKIELQGIHIAECPVHHFPRRSGNSQFFSFHNLSKTLSDFFTLKADLKAELIHG